MIPLIYSSLNNEIIPTNKEPNLVLSIQMHKWNPSKQKEKDLTQLSVNLQLHFSFPAAQH
jgi:hypothetical protein